jgi:hypothetical protein
VCNIEVATLILSHSLLSRGPYHLRCLVSPSPTAYSNKQDARSYTRWISYLNKGEYYRFCWVPLRHERINVLEESLGESRKLMIESGISSRILVTIKRWSRPGIRTLLLKRKILSAYQTSFCDKLTGWKECSSPKRKRKDYPLYVLWQRQQEWIRQQWDHRKRKDGMHAFAIYYYSENSRTCSSEFCLPVIGILLTKKGIPQWWRRCLLPTWRRAPTVTVRRIVDDWALFRSIWVFLIGNRLEYLKKVRNSLCIYDTRCVILFLSVAVCSPSLEAASSMFCMSEYRKRI